MKFLISLIILLVFASICTQQSSNQSVNDACISLCSSVKDKQNLNNGPCLSDNNPNWTISAWVCDVAHSPRQDIDDLPENQCQAFRNGQAHHFVEVDLNCNLIRAI